MNQPASIPPGVRRQAAVLLAVFALLLGMATFRALHESVHADAASASHHCAVTLFAAGQVELPAQPAMVPPPPIVTVVTLPQFSFLPSPEPLREPTSRGPPAVA